MMEETLTKQIDRLNKSEKIRLVESLWDSIASDPADVPLPNHHETILGQRLKTIDEDSRDGKSWNEFRKNYL